MILAAILRTAALNIAALRAAGCHEIFAEASLPPRRDAGWLRHAGLFSHWFIAPRLDAATLAPDAIRYVTL